MVWKSISAGPRGYKKIPRCRATLNNGERCQGRPEARWSELGVAHGYCSRHRREPEYIKRQREFEEQQDTSKDQEIKEN